MANLFVTYDLYAPVKNYPRVEAAIRSLGTADRVLLSVWYVKTAHNAESARNILSHALDENDKLLVVDAANAFGWGLNPAQWTGMQQLWLRAA